jgi:hypothetical protein
MLHRRGIFIQKNCIFPYITPYAVNFYKFLENTCNTSEPMVIYRQQERGNNPELKNKKGEKEK